MLVENQLTLKIHMAHLGSEVEGKRALADPNREIGFGFVSCSCRACERARRSCVGVRGDVLLVAGGSAGNISSDSGLVWPWAC